MALWLFVVSRLIVNDKVRDCSGRSGKGAGKVEGSVRLLLPLYEVACKGIFCVHFVIFSFYHSCLYFFDREHGFLLRRDGADCHRQDDWYFVWRLRLSESFCRVDELCGLPDSLFRDSGRII
jgi:hypothetical protein